MQSPLAPDDSPPSSSDARSRPYHYIPVPVESTPTPPSPSHKRQLSLPLVPRLSRHLQLSFIRLRGLLSSPTRLFSLHPRLLLLSLLSLLCLLPLLLFLLSSASFCLLPPSLYSFLHPPSSPGPWMDPRESALLRSHLSPNLTFLEYGSGASSFSFSPLTRLYLSIEHSLPFCLSLIPSPSSPPPLLPLLITQVHGSLHARPVNWTVLYRSHPSLHPPSPPYPVPLPSSPHLHIYCVPATPTPPPSPLTHLARLCVCCLLPCPSPLSLYRHYVEAGPALAALYGRVDGVLVDGRARPQAAYASIRAVKPGGVVMVHDWNERERYREVLRWMEVKAGQYESEQPGGGGLVVLRVKPGVTGTGGEELEGVPAWWW